MTASNQRKITAVETRTALHGPNTQRWKFEMDSILHPGQKTRSIHTWASKSSAIRAGRNVWGKS